jgi:hypothetical protein
MEARTQTGIPVKLSVLADLLDVARLAHVDPPFDPSLVDLSGVRRVVESDADDDGEDIADASDIATPDASTDTTDGADPAT